MGFQQKWILWILSCVTTASASILINDSPTPPIKLKRGLRQEDPLSPLLFDLMVEPLSLLILKATSLGLWTGVEVCSEGPMITHLQYVDDTLIFFLISS